MMGHLSHARAVFLAGALAAGTVLGGLMAPRTAHAQWSVCRSDPLVWLSNGALLDITAAVQADRSSVSQIDFTVHVPAGSSMQRAVYTQNVDPSYETLQVVPDSPSGYMVEAVATTDDEGSYPVILRVHLVSQGSSWSASTGVTNQDVLSFISRP